MCFLLNLLIQLTDALRDNGNRTKLFEANPNIKEEWDRSYDEYRMAKVDPSKEADNIYYIYMQNSREHKGLVLQESIP